MTQAALKYRALKCCRCDEAPGKERRCGWKFCEGSLRPTADVATLLSGSAAAPWQGVSDMLQRAARGNVTSAYSFSGAGQERLSLGRSQGMYHLRMVKRKGNWDIMAVKWRSSSQKSSFSQ